LTHQAACGHWLRIKNNKPGVTVEYNARIDQQDICSMKTLTIYILCHNRPDDARQAILSVIKQSDQSFTLTVSDNSSNDEVEHMVKSEFPGIDYVRRLPMLPALDHFNRCIEEAQSDYFCLFHDDDLMSTDFVSVMNKNMRDYPSAIAFACNANIENFGKLGRRPSFRSYRSHELIKSPHDLAMRYFSRAQSGIAPFPSYVYNRLKIGALRIPAEGGKYADVTWLLNLAKIGQIVWINQSLMTYRMHASNDGNVESLRDRLRFLRYLKQNRSQIGESVLQDYRCSFIYKRISKFEDSLRANRRHVANSFLKNYRWSRYARLDTSKALVNRALIKLKTK
jgi:GT2 family glycosyltransferase